MRHKQYYALIVSYDRPQPLLVAFPLIFESQKKTEY